MPKNLQSFLNDRSVLKSTVPDDRLFQTFIIR